MPRIQLIGGFVEDDIQLEHMIIIEEDKHITKTDESKNLLHYECCVCVCLYLSSYMLCTKSFSCIDEQFLSCTSPPGQSTSHSVPQLWPGC